MVGSLKNHRRRVPSPQPSYGPGIYDHFDPVLAWFVCLFVFYTDQQASWPNYWFRWDLQFNVLIREDCSSSGNRTVFSFGFLSTCDCIGSEDWLMDCDSDQLAIYFPKIEVLGLNIPFRSF
ncbi:Uncharacterised protein r2_g586 [Pycnogonum litorale]